MFNSLVKSDMEARQEHKFVSHLRRFRIGMPKNELSTILASFVLRYNCFFVFGQVSQAIQPLMAVHTISGYCFWCCGLLLLVVLKNCRRWWCCGGGVGHLCLACTRQLLVPTKSSFQAFQPTSCLSFFNKCPEPVR